MKLTDIQDQLIKMDAQMREVSEYRRKLYSMADKKISEWMAPKKSTKKKKKRPDGKKQANAASRKNGGDRNARAGNGAGGAGGRTRKSRRPYTGRKTAGAVCRRSESAGSGGVGRDPRGTIIKEAEEAAALDAEYGKR